MIVAKKNTAYYLSFPAIDSAAPESYKTGVSPVDTAYYKDGAGAWTSLGITDTATEIGVTGVYEIDLTAAEMNHDKVIIKFSVSGMADDAYQFDLRAQITDDLATSAALATVDSEVGQILADTGTDGVVIAAAQTVATVTDVTNLHASAATAAALTTVDGIVDSILVDTGTTIPGTITTMQGNVTDILADTNELQSDDVPGLIAALDVVVDRVEADTQDIQSRIPSALIAVDVTFSAGGTTTTAVFNQVDGAAASSTDDVYNGRVLVFMSPAGLKYQATDITDYDGATLTATITAVTAGPVATATAIML